MSGHNKWSKIKRAKGVSDAKKGQTFTKLTRAIILATKEGGPNPDGNFKLRLAIQAARDASMPLENVERAIKKGSGDQEGVVYKEFTMEGYGPNGVAIMANCLTDNHNRTVQEVRSIFTRYGGNLGENGSVSWMFDNRGVITVDAKGKSADDIELAAIDAGAEDVKTDDGTIEIYTRHDKMEAVKKVLEAAKIPIESAELSLIPKAPVDLDEKAAMQALKLMEKIEELDDVQSVVSNANFSDEIMEKYQAAAV